MICLNNRYPLVPLSPKLVVSDKERLITPLAPILSHTFLPQRFIPSLFAKYARLPGRNTTLHRSLGYTGQVA